MFHTSLKGAERLLFLATEPRLRPLTYAQTEPPLHAALASSVSAWEAYNESIVIEWLDAVAIGATQGERTLAYLLKVEAQKAVEKFNTPNAENCRELISRFTGFDSFSTMQSSRLGLPAHQARERLNQTLKVRHSFAHGYSIPDYAWTTRAGIRHRLTKRAVRNSFLLLDDLASSIDQALSGHLLALYPNRTAW